MMMSMHNYFRVATEHLTRVVDCLVRPRRLDTCQMR